MTAHLQSLRIQWVNNLCLDANCSSRSFVRVYLKKKGILACHIAGALGFQANHSHSVWVPPWEPTSVASRWSKCSQVWWYKHHRNPIHLPSGKHYTVHHVSHACTHTHRSRTYTYTCTAHLLRWDGMRYLTVLHASSIEYFRFNCVDINTQADIPFNRFSRKIQQTRATSEHTMKLLSVVLYQTEVLLWTCFEDLAWWS